MIPRRQRVFLWAGPLIVVNWLTVIAIEVDSPLALGYVLGSMFGQATIAAAWTAFGPGPLIWRLPFSLVWLLLLAVVVGLNVLFQGGPDYVFVALGLCFLGQFIALLLPFLGAAVSFGLHLQHVDERGESIDRGQFQFGIRQLMIVTALAAVVLGLGRLVVLKLPTHFGEIPIFIFLAVVAVVITLPILLAGLMRRLTVPGLLLSAVFIAALTYGELPLLLQVHSTAGIDISIWDFIAINSFTAAMVLALVAITRANGYCLYLRGRKAQ